MAANIRRLRMRAGLTRKQLAELTRTDPYDETTQLLSTDAIQKIENGAAPPEEGRIVRHVTADELLTLAVALEATPNALLLPPAVREDIEVTGVGAIPARDAWRWARGRNRLPRDMGAAYVPSDDDEEDAAIDAAEREKDLQFRRENAPDDPPALLPSDMTSEQMKAVLAVNDAVKAAQDVGLRPKAVTNYARGMALTARLREAQEQRRWREPGEG